MSIGTEFLNASEIWLNYGEFFFFEEFKMQIKITFYEEIFIAMSEKNS